MQHGWVYKINIVERNNWESQWGCLEEFTLLFGWNKLYDWKKKPDSIIVFVKNRRKKIGVI